MLVTDTTLQWQSGGLSWWNAGRSYIITNNHVVENQQSLAVIFADGSRHEATLVGTDPLHDVAVIKVNDPAPAVAALGDSSALQPGETVIAIGSPLGDFKNTVTVGVVSALNRSVPGSSMEGPDRRSDQSRQQRWPTGQPARPGGRHQHAGSARQRQRA